MIAGPGPTAGEAFDRIAFNARYPSTDPVTGQPLTPTPFHTVSQGFSATPAAGTTLPYLGLTRVFVLTGPGTCSASEAIMNGLKGVDVQVIQIGSTTCAAADECASRALAGKQHSSYAMSRVVALW